MSARSFKASVLYGLMLSSSLLMGCFNKGVEVTDMLEPEANFRIGLVGKLSPTISDDGMWLAGYEESGILCYHLESGERQVPHRFAVPSIGTMAQDGCPLVFLPESHILVAPAENRTEIIYWDCDQEKVVFRHPSRGDAKSYVRKIRASADGKNLVWDDGKSIWLSHVSNHEAKLISNYFGDLKHLGFINNNQIFAVSENGQMMAYDFINEESVSTEYQPDKRPRFFFDAPYWDSIIGVQEQKTMKLFDPRHQFRGQSYRLNIDCNAATLLSPRRILLDVTVKAGYWERGPMRLEIWDYAAGKCLAHSKTLSKRYALVGCKKKKAFLFNQETGEIYVFDVSRYVGEIGVVEQRNT
jgi:hypothetical protein